MKKTPFTPEQDTRFMHLALVQAQKAFKQDEVPIGAVIVNKDGAVIARAYNKVESAGTQCAHAEMRAIMQANKRMGNWRLDGCWIYVTLQPCVMCMGLIWLSRLQGLVYAAESPLFGCKLDKLSASWVYRKDTLIIISGVGKNEAADLLKQFFLQKRKKG